ncbi:MAG TPA: KR domain-containing protein, partial [Pyrinomonadaceae bacterium]
MKSCGQALEAELGEVRAGENAVRMYSTVTGAEVNGAELGAGYWARNVASRVEFMRAVGAMGAEGLARYVEVGAERVLWRATAESATAGGAEEAGIGVVVTGALRRKAGAAESLREGVAELYASGAEVSWEGLNGGRGNCVRLPAYPWQRQRFWLTDGKTLVDSRGAGPLSLGAKADTESSQVESEWLYEVRWDAQSPTPSAATGEGAAPKRWLILADGKGVGAALAERLRGSGHSCLLAFRGEGDEQAASQSIETDSVKAVYGQQALDELFKDESERWDLIVHLWSLDSGAAEESPAWLEEAERVCCGSALSLLQRLSAQAGVSSRLWLVTRGAQAVGGKSEHLNVGQSPLWGLGRVMGLEHPGLWGGLVDLDPAAGTEETADALMSSLLDAGVEDQLAFRKGQRYVARLARRQPADLTPEPPSLNPDATYMITGGVGVLGLTVARWMVERGARSLVLVGRGGLERADDAGQGTLEGGKHKALAVVDALEKMGAAVRVVRADVADLSSMAPIFEELRGGEKPLRGIVHAAGLMEAKPLSEMDVEALLSVSRPKVSGTWVLHQLSRELSLDFFVLFSSAASVWGLRGFAHYSAANHFLDVMAHYRRGMGLPAVTINWGPWATSGDRSDAMQKILEKVGVRPLVPWRGLRALGQLLNSDGVQTVVADVDWGTFKPIYEARRARPLLKELAGAERGAGAKPAGERPAALAKLYELSPREQHNFLVDFIRDEVASVLGYDPSQLTDTKQGLFEMGFDSLMAVELNKRLEAVCERPLPPTMT